jgi:hypothetical protein
MEALHAQAVAIAIAGEVTPAVPLSEEAVSIARHLRSPRAHQIIGTHGNILLGVDPDAGVSLLRDCLANAPNRDGLPDVDRVQLHLCIGLTILAHRCAPDQIARRRELLTEARQRLSRVYGACFRLGLYPDAGAAALLLGLVEVLEGSGDAPAWFAQAVAAAARGQQLETLWKAHINLALALFRDDGVVSPTVRDHARAALDIMEDSLSGYAEPDRSPRFSLLRTSLAHAVQFLIVAGDDAGLAALERHPGLRSCFVDVGTGELRQDFDVKTGDHEWTLRVGAARFVLY